MSNQLTTDYDEVEIGCLYQGFRTERGDVYIHNKEDEEYFLIEENQPIVVPLGGGQSGTWERGSTWEDIHVRRCTIQPEDWVVVTHPLTKLDKTA